MDRFGDLIYALTLLFRKYNLTNVATATTLFFFVVNQANFVMACRLEKMNSGLNINY